MELLHSHQFSQTAQDPSILGHVSTISEANLREWVAHIATPRHPVAEAAQNRATAEWLAATFRSFGYAVQFQGRAQNVIASKNLPPGRPVNLVGAHYDSVPGCPGADDNGSAVAAMLGCAGALSETSQPLMFVAFNCEEDGFVGSREFVEEFVRPKSLSIACAHILEMVGYASDTPGSQHLPTGLPIHLPETGNFLGLLANGQSAQAMRSILECTPAYTPELPVTGLTVIPGAERAFPVLARSDHVPFWTQRLPAVMWTDTAEFRNPHYHRATDTPETLNYDFLKQVTQLLTATVACGGVAA